MFHIPAEERKGVNVEGFGGGEAHKRYVSSNLFSVSIRCVSARIFCIENFLLPTINFSELIPVVSYSFFVGVADQKLFFRDSDPTCQVIADPDPTL